MRSVLAIAVVLFGTSTTFAADLPARMSVCFTPAEHCEPKIVAAIDAAKSSIRLQAYSFTSQPIIKALQRAEARGVEVMAILDKENDKKTSNASLLVSAGIPVWIDYKPAIAHNKLIVIDQHLTIGGSFNYTASAENRNAENATFTESKPLAAEFLANWDSRQKVSREFQ